MAYTDTHTLDTQMVATIDDSEEDRSSFTPRELACILSQILGTSYIRKYNGYIDDAIKADDASAVRMMMRMQRDRSMIDNIFVVTRYLGQKNMGGDSIDDILSLSEDEHEKERLCHSIAYNAASHGHMDLVITMIDRGGGSGNDDDSTTTIRLNDIAHSAARGGRMDIVTAMIKRGADDWNRIASGAAEGGRMDIVTEMIEGRGANDWNTIAYSAAKGGHMNIVTAMIGRGADDWNQIAAGAAEGGRMDIVMEMIARGANDWNEIAAGASEGGHTDIVIAMIGRGANDWSYIASGMNNTHPV